MVSPSEDSLYRDSFLENGFKSPLNFQVAREVEGPITKVVEEYRKDD